MEFKIKAPAVNCTSGSTKVKFDQRRHETGKSGGPTAFVSRHEKGNVHYILSLGTLFTL